MDAYSLPLSYEYSKYLFYSSFLLGISSVISLYYKDILTFLFMFILFISSICFWYRPTYGLIRNIDRSLCKIITIYFLVITIYFYDEYSQAVYINSFYCGIYFYIIELICYAYKSKKWIIFHMAIHFYVSLLTPFVLYIL